MVLESDGRASPAGLRDPHQREQGMTLVGMWRGREGYKRPVLLSSIAGNENARRCFYGQVTFPAGPWPARLPPPQPPVKRRGRAFIVPKFWRAANKRSQGLICNPSETVYSTERLDIEVARGFRSQ